MGGLWNTQPFVRSSRSDQSVQFLNGTREFSKLVLTQIPAHGLELLGYSRPKRRNLESSDGKNARACQARQIERDLSMKLAM